MRPTCRMSPVPAMPMTRVEKISGAMIDLIRLRKRSESGRTAVPHSGAIQPRRTPRMRPMKIFVVRDTFGSAMRAQVYRTVGGGRLAVDGGPFSVHPVYAAACDQPSSRSVARDVGGWERHPVALLDTPAPPGPSLDARDDTGRSGATDYRLPTTDCGQPFTRRRARRAPRGPSRWRRARARTARGARSRA